MIFHGDRSGLVGLVKQWRLKLGQGQWTHWRGDYSTGEGSSCRCQRCCSASLTCTTKCVHSSEVRSPCLIKQATLPSVLRSHPCGCVIAENRRIELAGAGNCGSARTRQPTHANHFEYTVTHATSPLTAPPSPLATAWLEPNSIARLLNPLLPAFPSAARTGRVSAKCPILPSEVD